MSVADELRAIGVNPERFDPHRDGFQRLPLLDKPKKRDGWAKVHRVDPLLVSLGNWKTGVTGVHGEDDKKRKPATKPAPVVVDNSKQQAAAAKAVAIWEKAKPCIQHPYLTDKRVRGIGLRELNGDLLIPVCDERGKFHSLQKITPAGKKIFMTDGRVKGHFYRLGERTPRIAICEGYATAATVHEALNWLTICAFNSGNLEPVASALRRIYPAEYFVFCADNDRHTPGNPGVTKALEAARKHGGDVFYPEFDDNEPGTDWNDLEALHGLIAVEVIYDNCT